MRTFGTGATRNDDSDKHDFRGFLSIPVLRRFAQYMHEHRKQKDGSVRDSDNWKGGIPRKAYVESLFRHVLDVVELHDGGSPKNPDTGEAVTMDEALAAALFNVQGLLHEVLLGRDVGADEVVVDTKKMKEAWEHRLFPNQPWHRVSEEGCRTTNPGLYGGELRRVAVPA